MKSLRDFAVAVLAGGKSRRFGRTKARALLRQKELIDYSLELAGKLSEDCFIVQGKTDAYHDKGVPAYKDIVPDCGPIGGVFTAIQSTKASWVATIPCDMPLLIPKIYHLLAKKRAGSRPVVAVSHAGIEPLVAFWPRIVLGLISEKIKAGEFGMHQLLSQLDSVTVAMADALKDYRPEFFFNVNQEQDLKDIPF